MGAHLEDRVALWLSAHPGATVTEIARAVRSADGRVREVLRGPLFQSTAEGKRVTYSLALSGADEVRRVRRNLRRTHKARVLELLSDGLPHSHLEGYQLNVMLHSRVADLRRDGYRVECWRDGDLYWYRLLDEPDVSTGGVSGSSSGRPDGSAVSPLGGGAAAAAQLVLPVGTKGAYS
jgi:hypothetical protein